jgi:hypothetical protein
MKSSTKSSICKKLIKSYDLYADEARTDLLYPNAKFSYFGVGGELRKAGVWLGEIDFIDEDNQSMILSSLSSIFKKVIVEDKATVYYKEGCRIHESFRT